MSTKLSIQEFSRVLTFLALFVSLVFLQVSMTSNSILAASAELPTSSQNTSSVSNANSSFLPSSSSQNSIIQDSLASSSIGEQKFSSVSNNTNSSSIPSSHVSSITTSSSNSSLITQDSKPKTKRISYKLDKKFRFNNYIHPLPVDSDWWLKDGSVGGNGVESSTLEINQILSKKFLCPEYITTNTCPLYTALTGANLIPKVKIAIIDSGIKTSLISADFDVVNSLRIITSLDYPNECSESNKFQDFYGLDDNGNDVLQGYYCKFIGAQFDEAGHGTGTAYATTKMFNKTMLKDNITILPIALHSQSLDSTGLSTAIRYAADQGVNYINLSIGSTELDNQVKNAIKYAQSFGAVVVASSGNCGVYSAANCDLDGDFIQTPGLDSEVPNAPNYPASYTGVISVGASNYAPTPSQITKAEYSNSSPKLSIVAPVDDGILLPCAVGCITDSILEGGTSFAAPQVAGSLTLFQSLTKALNVNLYQKFSSVFLNTLTPELRLSLLALETDTITPINDSLNILETTAFDLGSTGYDSETGNGLLNLVGATKKNQRKFIIKRKSG